ncbi:hypothetical protein Amet_0948 [Alkaliphilus metalliredigens QYMF]|uniref:Nicotianamine synthase protein n=1 Tax=Alkaliphilus metalliredigens (strain QYMF) TaxID=293826 RepID=A6TLV0_ALKMQ|nr:hypothetical protein [Alkaliphilus metalliredigens]ABR47168.1 hypothetical protein Amet_0948 [Alkaliphilus metalliredigens QYMF]
MIIVRVITKLFERLIVVFPLGAHVLFRLYYCKIVKREMLLGEVTESDQVLCIGGGPIPATALEIARQTGARVSVIDNDPRAVKMARRFVRELKLNEAERIEVMFGDGKRIDAKGYTIVHIAKQAYPHDQILKNILGRAPGGARILVRCEQNEIKQFHAHVPEMTSCNKGQCIFHKHSQSQRATIVYTKEQRRDKIEETPFSFDYVRHYHNHRSVG